MLHCNAKREAGLHGRHATTVCRICQAFFCIATNSLLAVRPVPVRCGAWRPVLIKKYGNRRLYDTGDSRYITLDELAAKIRSGVDVRVLDAQTGDDLTQATLTQLVLETGHAAKFLPVQLLTQMIRLSDDSLAEFFSRYVTSALDLYLQAKRGVQSIPRYNPLAQIPLAATDALARMWMGSPTGAVGTAPRTRTSRSRAAIPPSPPPPARPRNPAGTRDGSRAERCETATRRRCRRGRASAGAAGVEAMRRELDELLHTLIRAGSATNRKRKKLPTWSELGAPGSAWAGCDGSHADRDDLVGGGDRRARQAPRVGGGGAGAVVEWDRWSRRSRRRVRERAGLLTSGRRLLDHRRVGVVLPAPAARAPTPPSEDQAAPTTILTVSCSDIPVCSRARDRRHGRTPRPSHRRIDDTDRSGADVLGEQARRERRGHPRVADAERAAEDTRRPPADPATTPT